MPLLLSAQRFGGNPAFIRWKQLESDTLRVIYPHGAAATAARLADIVHELARKNSTPLGTNTRRIDVVLQTQPVISNAYVGLAPWRSEFYLTPLQNSLQLGSIPWADMLALHEYRHVHQYANFRHGLARFAWLLAGEQGQALANAVSVPDWFFEGDAVVQETRLSQQGRGRLPDFFNGYRSLWAEGRTDSYMKLRNGSLRDFVPNHYELGYLLVAAGRDRFGADVWSRISADAAGFRPLFFPLQGSFRRHTGLSFKTFAQQTLRYPGNIPVRPPRVDSIRWITETNERKVTDHQFPVVVGRDSLLVLRRSYGAIPAWYLLHRGQANRLAIKDIGIDDYYTHGSGRLAYISYRPHPRWSWQEYGEVMIIDIHTGRRKQLTHRGRYFSPGISGDGTRVAAVQVDESGNSELHVLDASDGRVIAVLPNPAGYFHTYPVFGQHPAEIISAVRDRKGRMGLLAFDTRGGPERIIVPFSNRPIAYPRVEGSRLTFTASFEGFDRLFVMNLTTGVIGLPEKLPAAIRGATLDTATGTLTFAAFTASGLRLGQSPLVPADREIPTTIWEASGVGAVVPFGDSAAADLLNDTLPGMARKEAAYSRWHRPLNLHSWRLGFEQPELTFSVYGENVLNTIRTTGYYRYNLNEEFHKFGVEAMISTFYPWIIGGVSYTRDRYFQSSDVAGLPGQAFRWNEWTLHTGLAVPLNLSRGRHLRYLNMSARYQHQGVGYVETGGVKPADRRIHFLHGSVGWSMQTQMARQQIHPRWAHALSISQRTGIGRLAASQFLGTTSMYLPGLTHRQSIVLHGAWQRRDTLRQYIFSNGFPLSRGYPGIDYPHMWKAGFNYHFTLAYPDIGWLQMVYLLRVRGNVFYDHTWVKSLRQQRVWALRSVGAELHFDTKWWNQLPVSFGVRYARLLDRELYPAATSSNRWEIIIPVDLIPGGAAIRR